jgi:hypothetical protein
MKKHEHGPREPKDRGPEEAERAHPHLGTERRIHVEIVRRWWEGSEPPSPEAYARALKQWRQLPGSIVTTATDIAAVTAVANASEPKQPR